ncbi:MAG: Fe(2+) transporter permease subunit FeoB [Zoogloeaceae bacterium]|jgi:ferrous iron transport protein B|nr:Fe(2+) transporter permease subunit FeoB [Zoogloeaceae bacterium]
MTAPAFTIALLGNPNCGKTTLFNALTGSRQRVGNWPGVTVEKKSGLFSHKGRDIEVIDLPGAYTLDTLSDIALDERLTRDFVLSGKAGLIINIADASNLERNLYLTCQLLEMRVPMILALNMRDVAESKGIQIDIPALSGALGCPVIPLTATRNRDVEALKDWLAEAKPENFAPPANAPVFPEAMEEATRRLEALVAPSLPAPIPPSWAARKALEGDIGILRLLAPDAAEEETIERERRKVEEALNEEVDIVMADARYAFIHRLIAGSVEHERHASLNISDRIDRIALNRFLGIPVFLAMMYLMFMFTIHLGGAFVDFFDGLAELLFVKGVKHLLLAVGAPEWLGVLLADGVGSGIQTLASFIPTIGFLFLFLSFLEDSGYMARAAFIMDRFMRLVGLPGKSFVPMVIGFGCNVPAVMASRTLESGRDRLMTIMMTPFMSCGARLPVYILFAAAFFPHNGQNLVFALYLIGIAAAVLTGLMVRRTLLPGQSTPFIMELPPYHLPLLRNMMIHAWNRLSGFIVGAGKVIVPMVMALNLLNATGTDGSFGHQDSESSLLSSLSRKVSPLFTPFGLTEENWPAAVGIITGALAKEAVVGTLNTLYGQIAHSENGHEGQPDDEDFSFWQSLREVAATVPEALGELSGKALDPLGATGAERSVEEGNIPETTFTTMHRLFGSTAAAFSYLLLILLYFPCVAALGAIRQEAGTRWMLFVALWNTALGFGVATLCYQALMFSHHPFTSALWLTGIPVFFCLALLGMARHGKRNAPCPAKSAEKPFPSCASGCPASSACADFGVISVYSSPVSCRKKP